MAYWLCDQRREQQSRPVMRFDPLYWTVNFPRPMMASVITTGPESLRVDATFYKSDELAGLIWDSEDTLDHPLLAYKTNRDYRRLTLSFRWRSQGIMPLDAINGPTLTINGRDQAGNRPTRRRVPRAARTGFECPVRLAWPVSLDGAGERLGSPH